MTRRDMLFTALMAVPKSEFDYVDWSWDKWRRITGEQRPAISTEQSGKAELVELAPATAREWPRRREQLERILLEFLGRWPASRPPVAAQTSEEKRADGFIRRKIRFQSEPGEWVPAWLLVPDGVRTRMPAVLCPHQTTQAGKDSPAGLADDPQQHTAMHLVRRGYVCITWDAMCFGERHQRSTGHYGDAVPFYRKHPRWSLLSKMAWDLSRAIDYLETLEFVDARRIGCVGHSHGGITTLFGMALDSRVAVGASNCGYDTFRIDGNTWRWSHATALLPRVGFYVRSAYINMDFYRGVPDSEVITTPFDMHQMLALIAPRALLLTTSDADFVFPNGGWSARQSLSRLARVYDLLGADDRMAGHYFSAGHSFPSDISARAYDWLDRWLKR